MKSNTQSLPGGTTRYGISDQAVRYTLRDNAFAITRNGNFQYERPLSKQVMDKKAPRLKISVSKDLTDLTISTVTPNGLKKIDLYKNDQRQDARLFAEQILDDLVANRVLEKVEA